MSTQPSSWPYIQQLSLDPETNQVISLTQIFLFGFYHGHDHPGDSPTCLGLVSYRSKHSNIVIWMRWPPICLNNLLEQTYLFQQGPREDPSSLTIFYREADVGSEKECGLGNHALLTQAIAMSCLY